MDRITFRAAFTTNALIAESNKFGNKDLKNLSHLGITCESRQMPRSILFLDKRIKRYGDRNNNKGRSASVSFAAASGFKGIVRKYEQSKPGWLISTSHPVNSRVA